MNIETKSDNLFLFGPEHCEAMILWPRSGFNGLHVGWMEFLPLLKEHGANPDGRQHGRSDEPRLIRLERPLGKLRYLYLHRSPDASGRVSDPHTVKPMVRRALDAVAALADVTQCCMNGIQGEVAAEGGHSREQDDLHARLMAEAAHEWCGSRDGTGTLQTIHLVDMNGGFGRVALDDTPSSATPVAGDRSDIAALSAEIQDLKRLMIESVKHRLNARAFELRGSATAMISALAEMLLFSALGPSENRGSLSEAEREWWRGFCQTLAAQAGGQEPLH